MQNAFTEDRTQDLTLTKRMLYQLSHKGFSHNHTILYRKKITILSTKVPETKQYTLIHVLVKSIKIGL